MISVIETEAAAVKAKLEAEIERAREESAKAQHSAYVNQSTEARSVLEGQYETANHTYEELKITRTEDRLVETWGPSSNETKS